MGKKENIQDAENLLSMIDKRSTLIDDYSTEELNRILPHINFNALKNSSSDSVIKFKDVLKKIIDGK